MHWTCTLCQAGCDRRDSLIVLRSLCCNAKRSGSEQALLDGIEALTQRIIISRQSRAASSSAFSRAPWRCFNAHKGRGPAVLLRRPARLFAGHASYATRRLRFLRDFIY